jgi:hypothetical protein
MNWADDTVLSRFEMRGDFDWMANNAGMALFASLHTETYHDLTIEFLSTFEDTLDTHQENCTVSFMMLNQLRTLSYYELCDCFGFPHDGSTSVDDEVGTEIMGIWERISIHRNVDYTGKKISTIQNPTIRYFAMFIANTLFRRGDMGAITVQDLSVLRLALILNAPARPNLGALLIHHFHRQRANPSGDIRVGGLITQISLHKPSC